MEYVFGSVFGADLDDLNKFFFIKSDKGGTRQILFVHCNRFGKRRTALRSASINIKELKSDQRQNQL